jgi:hypothetical protein
MNPKTYLRPKSIFLPAIALLESFPDLDLDWNFYSWDWVALKNKKTFLFQFFKWTKFYFILNFHFFNWLFINSNLSILQVIEMSIFYCSTTITIFSLIFTKVLISYFIRELKVMGLGFIFQLSMG